MYAARAAARSIADAVGSQLADAVTGNQCRRRQLVAQNTPGRQAGRHNQRLCVAVGEQQLRIVQNLVEGTVEPGSENLLAQDVLASCIGAQQIEHRGMLTALSRTKNGESLAHAASSPPHAAWIRQAAASRSAAPPGDRRRSTNS